MFISQATSHRIFQAKKGMGGYSISSNIMIAKDSLGVLGAFEKLLEYFTQWFIGHVVFWLNFSISLNFILKILLIDMLIAFCQ